jgi:hypothetical protein
VTTATIATECAFTYNPPTNYYFASRVDTIGANVTVTDTATTTLASQTSDTVTVTGGMCMSSCRIDDPSSFAEAG